MSTLLKSSVSPTLSVGPKIAVDKMKIPKEDNEKVCKKLLQDMSKNVPKHMLVRDAVQNSIDAVLMNKQGSSNGKIHIDPFAGNKRHQLAIYDNGIGMTKKIIQANYNSMYNSAKQNIRDLEDFDECKGIGIKITSYGWADLNYKTRGAEGSCEFDFVTDDDGYAGLQESSFTDEDGDRCVESIMDLNDDEFRWLENEETGTELSIHGKNDENISFKIRNEIRSIFSKTSRKENTQPGWVFIRYLNMRYFSIPVSSLTVHVGPDEKNKKELRVPKVRNTTWTCSAEKKGTSHYQLSHKNKMINFSLNWYIMKDADKIRNHSHIYFPFFAIKYKNELYGNMESLETRKKMLRNSGCGIASGRVVLIVDFETDELSVTPNREDIRIDGDNIKMDDIFYEIASNLPDEIIEFKAKLLSEQDLTEISEGVRKFLKQNYKVEKQNSKPRLVSTNLYKEDTNGGSSGNKGITSGKGNGSDGVGRGLGVGTGGNTPSHSKAQSARKPRKAKTNVKNATMPKIVEDINLPDDKWAYMDIANWTLQYNPNYEGIEKQIKFKWLSHIANDEVKKMFVIQGFIAKSVQWVFHQSYMNSGKQDVNIQTKINDTLSDQAWLSSSEISNLKRSNTLK